MAFYIENSKYLFNWTDLLSFLSVVCLYYQLPFQKVYPALVLFLDPHFRLSIFFQTSSKHETSWHCSLLSFIFIFFLTSVFTSDFTNNFLFGLIFNYFLIFFPGRIMLLTRDFYSFKSNVIFHQGLESHWSLLSTFRTLPSWNQAVHLTIPSSLIVGCLWSNLLFFPPRAPPLPCWLEETQRSSSALLPLLACQFLADVPTVPPTPSPPSAITQLLSLHLCLLFDPCLENIIASAIWVGGLSIFPLCFFPLIFNQTLSCTIPSSQSHVSPQVFMTLSGLTLNLISLEQTSHKLQCLQTVKGLLLYVLGIASSDAYLPLPKSTLPFYLLNYSLCLPS